MRIELDQTPAQVMKQIERCDAVLLPGSRADVDPQNTARIATRKRRPLTRNETRSTSCCCKMPTKCASPCWASATDLQSLNVYRSGIAGAGYRVGDVDSKINHSAGRAVAKAHTVKIEPESRLAEIVGREQNAGREFFASSVGGRSGRWAASGGALRGRRNHRGSGRNRSRTFCAGGAVASGAECERWAGGGGVGEGDFPRVHRGGESETCGVGWRVGATPLHKLSS